jgi:hypothetical protein
MRSIHKLLSNPCAWILFTLLAVASWSDAGSAHRAGAPPRSVVDYYLLLPSSYFDIDSAKERLRLCHGPGTVIDTKNGYLRTWGDGAQEALTVCLFRQPDHSYLVAVNANRASDGDWEPVLDFYRYRHGRLARAVPTPLPRGLGKQLGYRLPRYGTTIQVVDEAGRTRYDLVWVGGRFRVRRPASRALIEPISPASKMPKDLYEERGYRSPDNEYIARLRHDEGDVWNLTIVDVRSRHHIVTADDVMNILWVPVRAHRLVVATCGIYGEAMLAQWDGGPRWRALQPVRHPENECFCLYGATRDGQSILFGHDPDLERSSGHKRNPLDRKRWLRVSP